MIIKGKLSQYVDWLGQKNELLVSNKRCDPLKGSAVCLCRGTRPPQLLHRVAVRRKTKALAARTRTKTVASVLI